MKKFFAMVLSIIVALSAFAALAEDKVTVTGVGQGIDGSTVCSFEQILPSFQVNCFNYFG